jgi:hypothetical protein
MKSQFTLFTTALLSSYATSFRINHTFSTRQLSDTAAEHMLTADNEMFGLVRTLIPSTGSKQGDSSCASEVLNDYKEAKLECFSKGIFEAMQCAAEASSALQQNLNKCNNVDEMDHGDYAEEEMDSSVEEDFADEEEMEETVGEEQEEEEQTEWEPQEGVFQTTCGEVEVDSRMNHFNSINVQYHNEKRRLHGSKELAYDHDLYLDALAYAQTLENRCGRNIGCMSHAKNLTEIGQGENLYASTASGW